MIKEHKSIMFMKIDFSYAIYLVGIVIFTGICLMISRWLPDETISGGINEVE